MKILWVVNIVFGSFCEEYGIKRKNVGGWIAGLANQLERYKEEYDIGFCFPIIDDDHMKNGVLNGSKFYSFKYSKSDYRSDVKDQFKEIILDFNPDVIHIWGTEYPHTLEMVNACEEMHCLDKAVIHIQGLVSYLARHYLEDIPPEYLLEKTEGYLSLVEERDDFVRRGKYEEEALRKVKHAIGRTDWDNACAVRLNPAVRYHYCAEVLRDAFYESVNTWNYKDCEKHSILVSQGHYPIKGLHYILCAMPDVLKMYPDAIVYIGGHSPLEKNGAGNVSPYGRYIDSLIKENHLEHHIIFLGTLDECDMIKMYQRCNVFVSSSSIENSPNSVCEAQMIGCPVVASYVGGVGSIFVQNGYSFQYQHNAEYMLAFYIKKLFDLETFKYMETGKQVPDEICNNCLEIYKEISGTKLRNC